jgi:aspartate aminotransferase
MHRIITLNIQLSDRINSIKPSPTLAVTAKAAELKAAGHDIIGLGAGEPDFATPQHINQAAKQAIDAGFTHYTAVDGIPELKQAIIAKFKRDNQLVYKPEQILVSCGAKHSIFNLMQALLNPGDEVVIPAPYWVSYPDMAILAGAKPVPVYAGIEQGFKITPAQLDAAITDKTKLLILCSPSNPTGVSYTKAELAALGEVLRQHPHVLIMSDDIYEHILWAEQPFANMAMACPDLYDRIVVINGVSKSYAMTGWRIGYAAGPVALIKAMLKMQSQSTTNPCSISQKAAVEALNGDQSCITSMNTAFKLKHDYVVKELTTMPGIEIRPADGAFYVFFKVSALIAKLKLPAVTNDTEFAEYLINTVGLALVPGSAFGAPGYLRASTATNMSILQDAMRRLRSVAESVIT